MELDLKNFERDRTDENLEWWMFEFDHRDFFIALNKESLLKILKWEELKSELFDMRMKQATAALEKSHKINEDRKTIARLKTVLAEKMVEEGGNK